MSAVNEWVVKEYFEASGFLVQQPRKYDIPGRKKSPEEEVDLIVFNPLVTEHRVPDHIIWNAGDLRHVSRAVVGVRGWHTERFYVSTLEQTPEILKFTETESLEFALRQLGPGPLAKILCIPRLPASGELKDEAIEALKGRGIDGVISFGTMLRELITNVEVNHNYVKSDLLQVIRLLKSYDLIKDVQMDLFAKRTRRTPRSRKADRSEKAPSA